MQAEGLGDRAVESTVQEELEESKKKFMLLFFSVNMQNNIRSGIQGGGSPVSAIHSYHTGETETIAQQQSPLQ